MRVAVLWLGQVSRDTAAQTYLTGLLEPLGAQPGLDVDVHVGDPEFDVPATCRTVRHLVPQRLGSGARILIEPVVAARFRERYDIMLAPFSNLPITWRGRSVVVHHNVLAFGENLRREVSLGRALWRPIAMQTSVGRATRTLAVSAYLRQLLLDAFPSLDPAHVDVAPCGVAAGLAAPVAPRELDRDAPQLLAVSALWPYKRLDQTIEMFGDVAGDLPRARLVIAGPGDGRERARLDGLARALGVDDRVEFVGHVPRAHIGRLYDAADALLHLSDIEAFGLAALEAMAAGVPVIAKRIPAVVEIGDDAPIWVDPGGSREERAAALRGVLDDDELRRRHIDRGIERAAGFTWRRTAELTAAALHVAMES